MHSRIAWSLCIMSCIIIFSIIVICLCLAVTPTTTITMVVRRPAHCAECAAAWKVNPAIRCTVSSTPSCRGACRTPAIVTITGLDCTAGSSGMASLARLSPTLSQWANRLILSRTRSLFSPRVSYVTGHWSVTRRSAGQWVVGGLVARPEVGFCLGRLAGKMSVIFFFFFVCLSWFV